MVKLAASSLPVLLLLFAAGCGRAPENTESIRQAVIEAVSKRMNVSQMDVDVASVNFKGEEAEATVEFRPKGSAAGSGVTMQYTLENKSGKWVVKSRAEGGSPHSGGMGAPSSSDLPQGHPTIGGSQPKPSEEAPKK